jgi:hypothetical protein
MCPNQGPKWHSIAPQLQIIETEHLMLCFAGKRTTQQRVQQIRLFPPPLGSAHFFRQLRGYYYEHREPGAWGLAPLWRKVYSIHFVEFITLGTRSTNGHCIQITDLNSLPAPQAENWIRTLGPGPPPTSHDLKQGFDNSSEANSRLGALFDFTQIPRRVNGEIPLEAGHVGYGLHFHEGPSMAIMWSWFAFQLVLIGANLCFPRLRACYVLGGLLVFQAFILKNQLCSLWRERHIWSEQAMC